ncbi:cupin domain-containing protein [Kaistia dalseonensis]|uniref:Oxalate decarboxylase n=1 Tax=Kaistia dalseonensis TaxID=410840 RepID=A0ABU0H0J6_9HYPH|nr:cupin domain-containing protein [Kaistia dalseonensis]MCX5493276.1 cupin domain-containing protein [Kaistia dalseonensis]MDQ0435833.1 oxalate decarboxylase [Kaistia dalseonensis]
MSGTRQTSPHVVSLAGQAPSFEGPKGTVRHVDADTLPILKRLSIRHLLLDRGGLREPHWHANAHELTYCVRGKALVTIGTNHAGRESFLVGPGEMFFAPSGSLHAIQNVGDETAEFVLAFTHERPEDFGLRASFGAMTPSVLGNTFDAPASSFAALSTIASGKAAPEILAFGAAPEIEPQARHVATLKYSAEATPAQIASPAGSAHVTKSALWPVLEDIAMFSVRITDRGMREPHWHPETAEMGYVLEGRARMTILDPDGSIDTYEIGPGDVYFIPRAYPHHIEDIGTGTFHVLIFFDRANPGDIGFRTLVGLFSRDVLAATFGIDEPDLPQFPLVEQDPLIVDRINPVDPTH